MVTLLTATGVPRHPCLVKSLTWHTGTCRWHRWWLDALPNAACPGHQLLPAQRANPTGTTVKLHILKFLFLIVAGSLAGGLLGWLAKCTGSG